VGAIPQDRRVTTRREIVGLLRGPGVHGADLELYWRPVAGGASRATCITPKYGHTSVERNRLRRRLTALLASELLSRPEPCDYLVRARSGAYDLDFRELSRALQALAKEMTT
jgi:ribonuclease P protein component